MRGNVLSIIGQSLILAGGKISRLSDSLQVGAEKEKFHSYKAWISVNGDKTLRLAYDLGQDSIVFDVGGYEGQFASDIFSKYCCKIFVFEPVGAFVTRIEERFPRNPSVKVFAVGLSDQDADKTIYVSRDSSSLYATNNAATEQIRLLQASRFIAENRIDRIDLMKINIEGGEYPLLSDLIQSGFIRRIVNIQVQFHTFFPDARTEMKKIQDELNKTHELTFQFPFVWENWALRRAE